MRLIASPSGMLCKAIARAVKKPTEFSVTEGDADADTLGDRVHRHHGDDDHRSSGRGPLEVAEAPAFAHSEPTGREGDRRDPNNDPDERLEHVRLRALVEQHGARPRHQRGGDDVGDAEPQRGSAVSRRRAEGRRGRWRAPWPPPP